MHLIPSGIFHPGKLCVIGNGVVIDSAALGIVDTFADAYRFTTDILGRTFVEEVNAMGVFAVYNETECQ